MGSPRCADAQGHTNEPVSFDIPSQPLSAALETYARLSGREVLYNGALTIGRRSNSLKGFYAPAEALRILLVGTELSAQFEDADFFVLTPPSLAERQAEARRLIIQTRYYGHLQTTLKSAFCNNRDVLPGNYRLAARLWIAPSGEVQQAKRLASTGDARRDNDLDQILRRIKFGTPPPDGVGQPITILIMPNSPGVRQACAAGGSVPPSGGAAP
ncbi:MAG: secretin and TonB N-terminal domain-containing protein [Pseudomonadota bacterium]